MRWYDPKTMEPAVTRTALVLLIAVVSLAGCGAAESGSAAAKLELRVYPVPAESTERLRNALEGVLASDDKSHIARVSTPMPGQLLVLAPIDLQGSIAAALKALSPERKAEVTPPAQLRLQLWTVDAFSGAAADDPAVASIAPALEATRKILGTVYFALRDSTSVVSGIGQEAERSWPTNSGVGSGQSPISQLQYSTRQMADGLALKINIGQQIPVVRANSSGNAGNVSYVNVGTTTTTPIRLGQTLVLSQSPLPNDRTDDKPPATCTTRLYVIRIDAVSSS